MKLTDLNPHWVSSGGDGITDKDGQPVPRRDRIGVSFDCPCSKCTSQRVGDEDSDFHLRHFISFTNPPDGGPSFESGGHPTWNRIGDTFETLVLQPSILSDTAKGGCGWHGYIGGPGGDKPGEVVTL